MSQSASHSPACAFLSSAVAVLDNGVERLLREMYTDTSQITSEDLCRLCCAVVKAQSIDILANLDSIVARYGCEKHVDKLIEERCVVNTSFEKLEADQPTTTYSCCTEAVGVHGRMLVATQGVGRGHMLMQESSYAAVKCGGCGCGDGPVLPEHILLASAIVTARHKNKQKYVRFLHTFYSGLTERQQSAQGSGSTENSVGKYKHRYSVHNPYQCIGAHNATNTENVPTTGDTAYTRTGSSHWPLRVQVLMALTCAISCLYRAQTEHCENYGPVKDLAAAVSDLTVTVDAPTKATAKATPKSKNTNQRTSSPARKDKTRSKSPAKQKGAKTGEKEPKIDMKSVWKERLFSDTRKLLQVLCRLPHNTHAISRVLSNSYYSSSQTSGGQSTSTSEVQQVRLGYAVFLSASAINHSCRPNASIRYSTLAAATTSVLSTTVFTSSAQSRDTQLNTHADPVLLYLQNIRIEIVSTQSIPRYSAAHTTSAATAAAAAAGDCTIGTGEVVVSYGPLQGRHGVDVRQKVLHKQYLFSCTCGACTEDLQNLASSTSAAKQSQCQNNTQSVAQLPLDPRAHVLDQIHDISHTPLGQTEQVTRSAVGQIERLSHPQYDTGHLSRSIQLLKTQVEDVGMLFSEVLAHDRLVSNNNSKDGPEMSLLRQFEDKKLKPLCTALLGLQPTFFGEDVDYLRAQARVLNSTVCAPSVYKKDPLYADFCGIYCSYLDMQGHILALRGDYAAASVLVNTAILCMIRALYDCSDVVIGRERVKLAGLLLSTGNRAACAVQVKCALDILVPLVSRDDPDLSEALSMYRFCRK